MTSPRVILSYKVNEDTQFNLQAARGFRLGGLNDPINRPLCSDPTTRQFWPDHPNWKDEKAWNYEIGAKTRFLDRRVTFNVSAFYSDIKDLQATSTAGTCSSRVVFNVPKARSDGVEAELFAHPNGELGLRAVGDRDRCEAHLLGPAPRTVQHGGRTGRWHSPADGAALRRAPGAWATRCRCPSARTCSPL